MSEPGSIAVWYHDGTVKSCDVVLGAVSTFVDSEGVLTLADPNGTDLAGYAAGRWLCWRSEQPGEDDEPAPRTADDLNAVEREALKLAQLRIREAQLDHARAAQDSAQATADAMADLHRLRGELGLS